MNQEDATITFPHLDRVFVVQRSNGRRHVFQLIRTDPLRLDAKVFPSGTFLETLDHQDLLGAGLV